MGYGKADIYFAEIQASIERRKLIKMNFDARLGMFVKELNENGISPRNGKEWRRQFAEWWKAKLAPLDRAIRDAEFERWTETQAEPINTETTTKGGRGPERKEAKLKSRNETSKIML